MKSIETSIAIGEMATSVGARLQSESHSGKLSTKDVAAKSGPGNTRLNPVQTDVSFSTYGSKSEHLAVVVTNRENGRGHQRNSLQGNAEAAWPSRHGSRDFNKSSLHADISVWQSMSYPIQRAFRIHLWICSTCWRPTLCTISNASSFHLNLFIPWKE